MEYHGLTRKQKQQLFLRGYRTGFRSTAGMDPWLGLIVVIIAAAIVMFISL